MTFVIAYLAGLLTLINPCVLPVLPFVLTASLHQNRRAPVVLALGMSLSFVVLGVGVAALGPALGIRADTVSRVAALMMAGFGLVLLVPPLGRVFSSATTALASKADAGIGATKGRGLPSQFLAGALLGAVWSPCIGPTLGAAIGMASSGSNLMLATLIMVSFALGVSTVILALAYGARGPMKRHMPWLRRAAEGSKPVLGGVFLLIGLGLYFGWNHPIEAFLLQHLPTWLVDFSVSI